MHIAQCGFHTNNVHCTMHKCTDTQIENNYTNSISCNLIIPNILNYHGFTLTKLYVMTYQTNSSNY